MQNAQERLYWNAGKTKLVAEGTKEAAFLYAAVGDEIPDDVVERFRLKDGGLPGKGAAKEADRTENKEKQPVENKEAGGDGNKGGGPGSGSGAGLKIEKGGAKKDT